MITDVLVIIEVANGNSAWLRVSASVLEKLARADVLLVGNTKESNRLREAITQLNDRIHSYEPDRQAVENSWWRQGLEWGKSRSYKFIIQLKGDLSQDPRVIPRMLRELESCDAVVASRYGHRGTDVLQTIVHRIGRRGLGACVRRFSGIKIRDVVSTFVGWRADVLRSVRFERLTCKGRMAVVELFACLQFLGARIHEVPVIDLPGPSLRIKFLDEVTSMVALAIRRLSRKGREQIVDTSMTEQSSRSAAKGGILVLALGGIGDTVLSFAMARQLRAIRPSTRIVALAMWPESAELLRDLGVFDRVTQHHFQSASLWKSISVLRELRRERFECSILTFPANRFEYNLVQRIIGAGMRIGHDYLRGRSFFYLRWLLTHRVDQTLGGHNVEENRKLLGTLMPSAPVSIAQPDISLGPLAPEYRLFAEKISRRFGGEMLGVHAGSSSYKNLNGKRWPGNRFAELCTIAAERGLVPVLFGSEQDTAVNRQILDHCPEARLIATDSIRHAAAMIQRCRAFVSNDSALAHLASALDVPTVMVTGPTDALEIGPTCQAGSTVSANLHCSPCFRVSRRPLVCRHPDRFACLKEVSVDSVWAEVESVVGWRNSQEVIPLHVKTSRGARPGAMVRQLGKPSSQQVKASMSRQAKDRVTESQ